MDIGDGVKATRKKLAEGKVRPPIGPPDIQGWWRCAVLGVPLPKSNLAATQGSKNAATKQM
jgi:hypothetical protein